jgi:hypothetical protein
VSCSVMLRPSNYEIADVLGYALWREDSVDVTATRLVAEVNEVGALPTGECDRFGVYSSCDCADHLVNRRAKLPP